MGEDCRVQRVGACGAAPDDGDSQLPGGRCVAFCHGNGGVLMARRVQAHADGVEGRDEECGVLAHEAEHGCDPVGLDVLRQHLVGGNGGMVQRMLPV